MPLCLDALQMLSKGSRRRRLLQRQSGGGRRHRRLWRPGHSFMWLCPWRWDSHFQNSSHSNMWKLSGNKQPSSRRCAAMCAAACSLRCACRDVKPSWCSWGVLAHMAALLMGKCSRQLAFAESHSHLSWHTTNMLLSANFRIFSAHQFNFPPSFCSWFTTGLLLTRPTQVGWGRVS